ncbi:hypothetical protein P4B35_19005 [Pontiellaceae bacterium B12227]|nr:hypothetical protein [Pontiellaceae bacterium B12227]
MCKPNLITETCAYQPGKHMLCLLLLTGISLSLLCGCRSSKLPDGPELARVEQWNASPEFYDVNSDIILDWLEDDTPTAVIQTPDDMLPNGLAASMLPFLVDWKDSKLQSAEERYVLVHNIQLSGNPILGISRNASVRIPVGGLERIEYVIVRYYLKGFAKYTGHVQLRFIFKEDQRPSVLGKDGLPDPDVPFLDDLILSWEAWRPPLTGYNFIKGLDPEEGYALTARLYAGGQRFLNDSLRGAVWDCYPLELPDHDRAEDLVLFAGLMMGDAVGRRTISDMLNEGRLKDETGEIASEWTTKGLKQARGRLDWDQVPDDIIKEYMKKADISYHMFSRSCISVTHAQIELAMDRLYDDEDLGPRKQIDFNKGTIPKWFDDVRDGNVWGIIKGAPGAWIWISRHSDLMPYRSYVPLEDAGLLKMDPRGKKPEAYRYGHKGVVPYGALKRNLM